MNHRPLCFYSIQGDLQCDLLKNNQKEEMPSAFNAQGEVEKIQPINTLNMGWPQKVTEPKSGANASVGGLLYRNGPAFVGFYKYA